MYISRRTREAVISMKGRTNAGGGKGVATTLKVKVTGKDSDHIGGTVTVSLGDSTIATSTTDSNGVCSFDLGLNSGVFSVSYIKDTAKASGSVTLTMGATAILEIAVSYGKYWGILIDESNTSTADAITYPETLTVNGTSVTNSAYGKTPAKSASNSFDMGGWDGDDLISGIKPVKSDMASTPTFTDAPTDASTWTAGQEYFTEFPFMWLSITKSGNVITVIMSNADTQPDDTFQCWAFAKANDGVSDTDIQNAASSVSRSLLMSGDTNATYSKCFRLGCFLTSGSTSGFYSKASTTVTADITLNKYWVGANARGDEYDCMSFAQWVHIQALFLILYKDRNSQTAHSYGNASGGNLISTNAGLSTTTYGMAGSVSSTSTRNAFFWIHDIWGNYYQFIASVFIRAGSTYKVYHTLSRMAYSGNWDNSSWNSSNNALMSSKGFDTGSTSTNLNNKYISACGTNGAGFLVASGSSAASDTTGWPDLGFASYYSSYASFPSVGGTCNDGAGAGLFYAYVYVSSTGSGSYCAARVSFRG